MRNKIPAILLFLFIYHGIAVGQSDSLRTDSLSLSEAISLALQENHNITVAVNATRIDENNATIGNAGYLPSVFATGSYNRTNENVTQNFASDTVAQTSQQNISKQYNAALNAEYTLFDGFGNYYRLQSLQSQEELGSVRSRPLRWVRFRTPNFGRHS